MDHQSVLIRVGRTADESGGQAVIHVDQAVFTSLRSPMGEGYRIIAASAGLRAEEKAEIQRRTPSHGSLSISDPDSVGLLSFPLEAGRHCVAMSIHAGKEHTARGGQRVYTHLALLEAEHFIEFACNPVAVHRALVEAIGRTPRLKPAPNLSKLALVLPSARSAEETTASGDLFPGSALRPVAFALLRKTDAIVVGPARRGEHLRWIERIVGVLPLYVRRSLAVSAGVTYSPSRRLNLCWLDRDAALQAERSLRGREIPWIDVEAAGDRSVSPFDPWLDFVERRIEADREAELGALTARMTESTTPEGLTGVASICLDTDLLAKADAATLDNLRSKYDRRVAASALESELLLAFKDVAARRAEQLEAQSKNR